MKGEILNLETAKRLHREKPEAPVDKKMYEANIKLTDENKWLKKDNLELQKKIDQAIEYIEQLPFNDLTPIEVKVIYKILQGSDKE